MVTLPVEGRWTLHPLHEDDAPQVLEFLRRDPYANVYLISRLLEDPAAAAAQVFVVRLHHEIVLVVSLSTNIVLGSGPDTPRAAIDTATSLVADRIIGRMLPVRAIISPADLVESLWKRLRAYADPPTVVRLNQPIYVLRRGDFPSLETARYATPHDLDQLVPACAAMHREEVGIDPLERDPAGYRDRIRELVEKKRSIVLRAGGTIVAKCEFSAITDQAVQ
ncbi:MAG TPA: hypothetical protein VNL91_07300, partial [Thermoanaerobaculia bacterium]|nr:hypothetical protein [Thermoanaerobaculia bacterium]